MVKVKLSGSPRGIFAVLEELGLAPRDIVIDVPVEKLPTVTVRAVQEGLTLTVIPGNTPSESKSGETGVIQGEPASEPVQQLAGMTVGVKDEEKSETPLESGGFEPGRIVEKPRDEVAPATPTEPPRPPEPTITVVEGKKEERKGRRVRARRTRKQEEAPVPEQVGVEGVGGAGAEKRGTERLVLGVLENEIGGVRRTLSGGEAGTVGAWEEPVALRAGSTPKPTTPATASEPFLVEEPVPESTSIRQGVMEPRPTTMNAPPLEPGVEAGDGDYADLFHEVLRVQEEALRRTPIKK